MKNQSRKIYFKVVSFSHLIHSFTNLFSGNYLPRLLLASRLPTRVKKKIMGCVSIRAGPVLTSLKTSEYYHDNIITITNAT